MTYVSYPSTHLNRHDSTATDVLTAVQKTMSEYGTTSVTMVGHSLGEYLQAS
jgi:surfactin synthase thioesterase subunit